MKKLIITEEERSKILGMHQNAVKKEFLNENKERNEKSIDDLLKIAKKTLTSESFSKLKSLLTEGSDLVTATLPNVDKAGLRAIPGWANAEQVVQKWIGARKIPFSVEEPAFWLTLEQLAVATFGDEGVAWSKKGYSPKILQKQIKDYSVDLVENVTNQITGNREEKIQLNENPDQKGLVLTVGTITATAYQPGDESGASNINDIATFCNDYNLKLNIANPGANASIAIEPYQFGNGKIIGGSFVEGNPKTTPGAGALNISEAAYGQGAILYATSTYKAASAKTAGAIKTDIKFTPGPELGSDLGEPFEIATITPKADLAQKVKEAVDSAKALGTITGIRIESGASFDEPVKYDRANFAKKVGMPVDKVPADPTKDQEGVVKDPMSGGNAFLAYYRGIAMQQALGNQGGVTPTMIAKVAKGGPTARYAKIFFTVKKPDQSTEITTQDVQSIGSGASSTDLGGLFSIYKYDLR